MRRRYRAVLIVAFMLCWITTSRATAELLPRTPLPKATTITRPPFESLLKIKFRDDLEVRAVSGSLTSLVGADLSNVEVIQGQFGLTFEQLIEVPQETLDLIETQAAQRSGVAQPDLGGMMVIDGPPETLEQAARALLALDEACGAAFAHHGGAGALGGARNWGGSPRS